MAVIGAGILAKSTGETLDEHTCQVAHKFMQLYFRTPFLADLLQEPRFWHRAFWSCFLHDFGKVAAGFQLQLRGRTLWGERHEVLSLAFLPWVVDTASEDFAWMAAAIASHHKDAGLVMSGQGHRRALFDYYPLHAPNIGQKLRNLVEGEDGKSITPEKLSSLAQILTTRIPQLYQSYGLERLGIEQQHLAVPEALNHEAFLRAAPDIILEALRAYQDLVHDLQLYRGEHLDNRRAIALRGMVLLSDRLASSHAPRLEPPDLPDAPTLFRRLYRPELTLRDHQRQAAAISGSIILSAPTGSGKTEAALLWARRQQEVSGRKPNLIYILPYQASMNAMRDRLSQSLFDYQNDEQKRDFQVALMHGRSAQVLFKQMLAPGSSPKESDPKGTERLVRRATDMARLYQPSVWVTTPYQLLKAAYKLPGYEMLWTAVAGARLIIDEIHAYDSQRLGLLLGLLSFLKKHWEVEICAMTATMPTWLRSLLQDRMAISPQNMLQPDEALFAHFRRHILQRLSGSLLDEAIQDRIIAEFNAGRSVLVCANTVKGAQAVQKALSQKLAQPDQDVQKVILLHSRFTGHDRQQKECRIMAEVKAGHTAKEPLIVVATQVIEVSLDLDFSTIFTEPAPLEALAQRFGRVNRRGTADQPAAPVYVLTEATSDATELIYDSVLLERTLELIEREDGQILDEARLCNWLDLIYSEDLAAIYKQQVLSAEKEFQRTCLDKMRAFQSDEALEDSFDQLFDGIEVLPAGKKADYLQALEFSALQAASYLVPITYRQFKRLYGRQIFQEEIVVGEGDTDERDSKIKAKVLVAQLDYSEDNGLEL